MPGFRCSTVLLLSIFLGSSLVSAGAQRRGAAHRGDDQAKPGLCFDAADPADIRLWPGRAPGAIGDDPCRDIPFMRAFRATNAGENTPAFLIVPGGGYDRLTDAKEQTPVARYFAENLHLTAFVLYYRLVQPDGTYRYPVPMWDGQRAIRLLRAQARQLGLDPRRLGLFGFSAGGHLASTLALHPENNFGLQPGDAVDQASARPDLVGLGYPVISMDPADVPPSGSYRNLLKGYSGGELAHLQDYLSGEKHVTSRLAPVFLFESLDDATISSQNSVLFANALKSAGVPADVHLFPHGVHGDGLAIGVAGEDQWPALFGRWLDQNGFTTPSR